MLKSQIKMLETLEALIEEYSWNSMARIPVGRPEEEVGSPSSVV
jgi:hypothetical protein